MEFESEDIFDIEEDTTPIEQTEEETDEGAEAGAQQESGDTAPDAPPPAPPAPPMPPQLEKHYDEGVVAENETLKKVLEIYGFKGSVQEIADQAEATAANCSIEEVRARREQTTQAAQQLIKTDPEYVKTQQELGALRAREAERVFAEDLAAVMAINPNETAKSISELGEDFIRLRAAGISADVAYSAVNAVKPKVSPPPNSGKVSAAGRSNTEFYTPEEVRAMSTEDVLKNLEKVEKSQKQWGM